MPSLTPNDPKFLAMILGSRHRVTGEIVPAQISGFGYGRNSTIPPVPRPEKLDSDKHKHGGVK